LIAIIRKSPRAAASVTELLPGVALSSAARRVEFLTAYQDAAYAERYLDRIGRVRAAEERATPGSSSVTEAAARGLFRMMAIKDEYEVARLYTDGAFQKQLAAQFEEFERLEFHLAPPILGRKGSDGKARKSSFGPWMMKAFAVLARLKRLRGSPLDIFGYAAERRMERRLLAEYEADLELIARSLTPASAVAAAGLASLPALIRGFGHVKEANAAKAAAERARLLARLAEAPSEAALEAAE
jgi:indolepyruvate ferredoxin oxidoreductase